MYNKLLKQYGYIESQVGVNEDGEPVIVSIDEDAASVSTIQKNGWTRVHIYHKNGIVEEYYKK